MSDRSRRAKVDLERVFLIESADVRAGAGQHDDGTASPIVNLELRGRWNGGTVETIQALALPDLADDLAALLHEGAAIASAEADVASSDGGE